MDSQIDAETLLALWESALGMCASARDDALLQASIEGIKPVRTLGERNARFVALHAQFFGREIELLSHCPECGGVVQFSCDCETLAEQMRPRFADAPLQRMESNGYQLEFRLPDSADVAIVSDTGNDDDFAQGLLERCLLACTYEGKPVPARLLPESVQDALSQAMEALDPGASLSFSLNCPQCATRWQAPLEIGEVLWQKVRNAGERLLLDVHALALAYGWTEPEVLRLSPMRRAAYLQMVAA
jgi:hypothetical protein